MEMSNQHEDMPMPINTTYDHHSHTVLQNHSIVLVSSRSQMPTNDEHVSYKKMVRYRECLKNHAAAMGGNATDGCGEFMPSGEEGSLEALTCSVCNCHRNFHRKESAEDDDAKHPISSYDHFHQRKQLVLGHHFGTTPGFVASRAAQGHHMVRSSSNYNMLMGCNNIASESDEQEDGGGYNNSSIHGYAYHVARPPQIVKKRYRTKFSQEQKEKMFNFAEKVGWKLQKPEETMVQQFCQEVGVKRRVLKVWMHNNKHNLAKKNPTTSTSTATPTVQIQE